MDLLNLNETLFDRVSSFENLYSSFLDCSKGKRKSLGYKNFLFAYGEKLKKLEEELKDTGNYNWSEYRRFFVYDPKKRLIMAAPFKDRVLHTAIHRIIEPIIDPFLGERSYACRKEKGNRSAVVQVLKQLKSMRKKRYCIKLDVRKYFQSINHKILANSITRYLPDSSINSLLGSLIASHDEYNKVGKGVPIGNLTSQLFANFYLKSFDELACNLLNIDFYNINDHDQNFYIRYMDDSIILTRTNEEAFFVANKLIGFAKNNLHLNIPNDKKVILANDPIPFLGFLLDEYGYRPLRRNERKLMKKLMRSKKQNIERSKRAQIIQSYEAWKKLTV